MLSRLVRFTTIIVSRRVHRVGQGVKHLLRPARTVAALATAAGRDLLRSRPSLVAENSLLRQQILILRRAAPARPRLHREDRLLLVLLARVTPVGTMLSISFSPRRCFAGIVTCSPRVASQVPSDVRVKTVARGRR